MRRFKRGRGGTRRLEDTTEVVGGRVSGMRRFGGGSLLASDGEIVLSLVDPGPLGTLFGGRPSWMTGTGISSGGG